MAVDYSNIDPTKATATQAGIANALNPQQGTAPAAAVTTAAPSTGVVAGNISSTQTNVTAPTATATNANASTYDPSMVTVDPKSTVSGQLSGIIAGDSPLMQQSRTSALADMNGRGILNSSLAIGAGQQAVINSALPIAQQDASTNFNTSMTNAAARNAAGQFNAGNQTDVSKFNAGQKTQVSETNAANKLQAATTTAQLSTQVATQNVSNALQAGIINKQQADQLAEFNATQANQTAQFNTGNAYDMVKTNLANALQAGIINQQQYNQMAQYNTTQQNQLLMQNMHDVFSSQISAADAQSKMQLTSLQGTVQENLANVEANYKTLMQFSQSASDNYGKSMAAITQIMTDANMTTEAKQTSINNVLSILHSSLSVQASANGIQGLDSLLLF